MVLVMTPPFDGKIVQVPQMVLAGDSEDEAILDQFASALTLEDQHGSFFWGSTYRGLLTVAVPRQWWPQKPGLADFEKDISTRSRPMSEMGMVVTMLGEFYLNFWYAGVIVMSFALAWALGSWFHHAYSHGYFTLQRFIYLVVTCNLLQVFRDGMGSLFVFSVINMMPMAAIAALHLLDKRSSAREPILKTPRVRDRHGEEAVV